MRIEQRGAARNPFVAGKILGQRSFLSTQVGVISYSSYSSALDVIDQAVSVTAETMAKIGGDARFPDRVLSRIVEALSA